MKKIIIVFEILILFLFVAKIFTIGEIVKRSNVSDLSGWFTNPALADSFSQAAGGTMAKDIFEDTLANERNLMLSLEDRQRQLESRENSIKFEEKKITSLNKEIVAKIEKLRGLEEKITTPREADKIEDKTKLKELAKAYEATPPDKVGALFNKMDKKTAAGIIMQMNIKKAGLVWAHLDPVKAVEIAKIIVDM